MPFLSLNNRRGPAALGEVTSDDVAKWISLATPVLQAGAPLIQTFIPPGVQQTYQQYLNSQPVPPPAAVPTAPPPAVSTAGAATNVGGFSMPSWLPWAALGGVALYLVVGKRGRK